MSDKKKILIIATGGTIAMKNETEVMSGKELLNKFPKLKDFVEVEIHEFSNIGSSFITPGHWIKLNQLLNKEAENYFGFVILHGTDTLEETSFFLNLTLKTIKPVIIVGSMRNPLELSSDVEANLFNALRLASFNGSVNQGVLVIMNDEISAGRDVMKFNNSRVNTMRSPYGFLGYTDADKIVFYRKTTRPHTVNSEFNLEEENNFEPIVPIISDYSGFDYDILKKILTSEMHGIVIQSFAGGRISKRMYLFITDILKKNIPVVIASRILEGRIFTAIDIGNLILAEDLTPQKARILLMLCLIQKYNLQKIKESFETY